MVTHSSKNAIENHFDKSFELETTLENRVKRTLLEEVQAICPKGITILHVRQGEAKEELVAEFLGAAPVESAEEKTAEPVEAVAEDADEAAAALAELAAAGLVADEEE